MRKIIGRFFLPALAAGLLVFAVLHVVRAQQTPPKPPPPLEPARTPFGATVAGAGIVEPANEASGTSTVSVGSQQAGVVVRVPVQIGQEVKAGDVLVEIDPRVYQAQVSQRAASLSSAQAALVQAQTQKHLADDTLQRDVASPAATTNQQIVQDRDADETATAAIKVAEANIELAKANLQEAQANLDLCTVRAPSDGTILQINIRPGEYVSVLGGAGLILMGDLHHLHVRVDVDEHDAVRFRQGAAARASLRGAPDVSYPLKFLRVEPYVVPKKSLTGDNTERVDTRVLQVIYEIDAKDAPIYVGQQMDVFIDAAKPGG
ncbi:MAG TPA: efflux RND transporter periplasmic adaptor subunit [Gemmataceae bacterium]|nr:efflux RND transporter periplasmic adaptor subunit [Gemmataceae bacterium]